MKVDSARQNIFKRTAAMVCIGWCAMASLPAWAVCYVDAAATGANNGTSWRDAYPDLQGALHNATCKEVWVKRGVYRPAPASNQTVSFPVAMGVQLYGGFAGTEATREARDPVANLTILSGDIDNNDANAATTNVDTSLLDIVGDNSYHVITINGASTGMITGPTVIDGFTITGGYAKYSGFHANGGGLNCDGHGDGSGTDAADCSPTLRHLVFSGNAAVGDGGAVYDNGLNHGSSSPLFEDDVFIGNSARNNGGALCNVADKGGSASPLLARVNFIANNATLGGALYDRGEGMAGKAAYSASNPILTDVTFERNSANTGGGMYSHALDGGQAGPIFHSVTFDTNKANTGSPSPNGGGLFALAEGTDSIARPQIMNSTFTGNQATFGGAVFYGTLSSNAQMDARMVSTTLSGNSAQVGGAIYDGGDGDRDFVSLTNVILWGDSASSDAATAEIKNVGMTLGIASSVLAGGCVSGVDVSCKDVVSTSPMLGPLQANGGFTRTMLPGAAGSAIDAGDDSVCPSPDQRGVARPQGPHCDIGSVEALRGVPPTAQSIDVTTQRGTAVNVTLQGADTNPGGPFDLNYALSSSPKSGSATLRGSIATYTPTGTFVGDDSFTYAVSDDNGTSAPAVVTVHVLASLPVAQPATLSVSSNTPGAVTLAATDDNAGGPYTYIFAITQPAQHGTAVLSGSTVTYTSASGYVGADSFVFTATDSNGTSLPATVSIDVTAAAPPVAQPRVVSVAHNTPTTVTFAATDAGPGGPYTFAFSIASAPAHGSLSLVEGTQVTYTPAHDYVGADSFTYTATDTNGTSLPATVTLTVAAGGGGPTPPPGAIASTPALSAWNMIGLVGLLGGFAVRKIVM